jgi:hypothetical protein
MLTSLIFPDKTDISYLIQRLESIPMFLQRVHRNPYCANRSRLLHYNEYYYHITLYGRSVIMVPPIQKGVSPGQDLSKQDLVCQPAWNPGPLTKSFRGLNIPLQIGYQSDENHDSWGDT